MVKPAARKQAVVHAREVFGVSERRASGLMRIGRSSFRYRSVRRPCAKLRERLIELAAQRLRFGYRRLHVLLRREGYVVNHKRVYRMYRQEGLSVRKKKRKRYTCIVRKPLSLPGGINERWSMDFLSDCLSDGRRLKVLTVLDDFSRESLALPADTSISGSRVTRILDELAVERGYPQVIVTDNGPEFTSRALDLWAYQHGVRLHFIEPGKPVQNALIESFNGKFRDECLNQHWFINLQDARNKIESWRMDYNHVRPHSSLGQETPAEFARQFSELRSPPAPFALKTVVAMDKGTMVNHEQLS
jgi:putative transposase